MSRKTRFLNRLHDRTLLISLVLSACAGPAAQTTHNPGVAFPVTVAEGSGDPEPPAAPPPASAKPPPPDPETVRRMKYGSLPDPTPLAQKTQWELEVHYDRGKLALVSAAKRTFDEPVVTPRRMGRFAVELWIGRELIDRVRFDFPLVGAPQPEGAKNLAAPVRLDDTISVSQTVLVPDSQRATRAVLVDRATGEETPLAWPPDRPDGPPANSPATDSAP